MSTAISGTGIKRRRPRLHDLRENCAGRTGFTLIEILAVVVIMGFLLALVLPNLGITQASALRDEARTIASQLELARQLAIVKGSPHRVLVDIDTGDYRIEWFGEARPEQSAEADLGLQKPASEADLLPPVERDRAYHPLENLLARGNRLGPDFYFKGLETSEGWFDEGQVQIVFERDGTTDSALLIVADDDGREIALDVKPLLDRVSIYDETI